jgi:hypothetical protein
LLPVSVISHSSSDPDIYFQGTQQMSNPPCHDSRMTLEQLMPVVEIQAAKIRNQAR